jgi:hypothetical protein
MVSDLRLSTADCRLLIVDYRLLIVDCCLPIGSEIWNLKSEVPRAGGECQAQASAPSRLSLWRKPWRPKFPTGTAHGRRNGRLPIVDCCLTIADSWLLTVDCRLPTAGCLMPILDCDCRRPATARPFSIADCRPPTAPCPFSIAIVADRLLLAHSRLRIIDPGLPIAQELALLILNLKSGI